MGDEYTLQPEARGGRNRGATKKKAEPAEQIRTAVRRLWASASEEEIDELVADWLSELPAEAAPKAARASIVENRGTVRFPNGRAVPFILVDSAKVDKQLEVVKNQCEAREAFAGEIFTELGILEGKKPKCAVEFVVDTPRQTSYLETPLSLAEQPARPSAGRAFSPYRQQAGRVLWERGDRAFDHVQKERPEFNPDGSAQDLNESLELLRSHLNDSEDANLGLHYHSEEEGGAQDVNNVKLVHRYCEHAADACKQMIECISEGEGVFVSPADMGPAAQMIGEAICRHDLDGNTENPYVWLGVKELQHGDTDISAGVLNALKTCDSDEPYLWPENSAWEKWCVIRDQVWEAEHNGSLRKLKELCKELRKQDSKDAFAAGVHPFHSHLVFYYDGSTAEVPSESKRHLDRVEQLLVCMNQAGVERCTTLASGLPKDLLHIQKRIKAKDAIFLLATGDGQASDHAATKVLQWKKKKLQNEANAHQRTEKKAAEGIGWLLLSFLIQQAGIWTLYRDVAGVACVVGWAVMATASLGTLLKYEEEMYEFHLALWVLAIVCFPAWVVAYIYENEVGMILATTGMIALMCQAWHEYQDIDKGDRGRRLVSFAGTAVLLCGLMLYGVRHIFMPGSQQDHLSSCPSQGSAAVLTGERETFEDRMRRENEDGRCFYATLDLCVFSCFFFLHMTMCNESEWACIPNALTKILLNIESFFSCVSCGVYESGHRGAEDVMWFIGQILDRSMKVLGTDVDIDIRSSGSSRKWDVLVEDENQQQISHSKSTQKPRKEWDWRQDAWAELSDRDKRMVCRLLNKNLIDKNEWPYLTYRDVRTLKSAYSLLEDESPQDNEPEEDEGEGEGGGGAGGGDPQQKRNSQREFHSSELDIPHDADPRELICVDLSDKYQIQNVYRSISQLMTYQSLVDNEFGYGRQHREHNMIQAWQLKIAELRLMAQFWSRLSDYLQTAMFLLQFLTVFLPMYTQLKQTAMENEQIHSVEDGDEVHSNETLKLLDTMENMADHDHSAIIMFMVLGSTLMMTLIQAYSPQQRHADMAAAAAALESEIFMYRCRIGAYGGASRSTWMLKAPIGGSADEPPPRTTAAEAQSKSSMFEERCEVIINEVTNNDDCRYGMVRMTTHGGKPNKALLAELRKLRASTSATKTSNAGSEIDSEWYARLDDDGYRQLTAKEYFDWRVAYLSDLFRGEIVSMSKWEHLFLFLKFTLSAVAVSLVGGGDDFQVAVASQLITLFIHIMLYFGWEKRLVQHHDAVKTIDSACSRWRALNAIEQTDADLWKPFVREIEGAFLLTHNKVLPEKQSPQDKPQDGTKEVAHASEDTEPGNDASEDLSSATPKTEIVRTASMDSTS